MLWEGGGVQAACFNSEVDDLLCTTSSNRDQAISVITGISTNTTSTSVDVQEQHMGGGVLCFRGPKIFCVSPLPSAAGVIGVDVPQGRNIQTHVDNNSLHAAYRVACLGATEADWKLLGMRALRANHLDIAKNAFTRLKDVKYLSLIDNIQRRTNTTTNTTKTTAVVSSSNTSSSGRIRSQPQVASTTTTSTSTSTSIGVPPLETSWLAEVMAYEGHHQEAAKMYGRSGKVEEAIRLLTDLRRWDDAKMFARNSGQPIDVVNSLIMGQAKWQQEVGNWRGAAETYMSLGMYLQAARTIADSGGGGWQEALIEVVRACPETARDALDFCGDKFSSSSSNSVHGGEEVSYARETYTKSKEVSKLMSLYANRHMWTEAARLADDNDGKFDVSVFLPYAEWLVSQDRYDEAMQAFRKSNRADLARRVLEDLTGNAVAESRFKDAAYYFWLLSRETEGGRQFEHEHKADLYFAYSSVHSFVTDPFTSLQPEMLFQVARFIINSLGSAEVIPSGISKAATVYTLARQAMSLGAFKLARHVYDRLSKMQLPARKEDEVEVDMLLVQAKPIRDDPDHLPVCYRCGTTNPLLNPFTNKFSKGDVCTNCGHPFVRSFINFDVLPLVEFVPEPSISDEEAIDMIRQPPHHLQHAADDFKTSSLSLSSSSLVLKQKKKGKGGGGEGWKEAKEGNADLLLLDGEDHQGKDMDEEDAIHEALGINANESDLFTRCLNLTLERQQKSGGYTPVKVDANTLLAMNRSEVFVCRPSSDSKRATFYRYTYLLSSLLTSSISSSIVRNMLPDIPIAISQPCHRFFHLEDFEFAYLSEQKCPYSRLKNVGEYGSL